MLFTKFTKLSGGLMSIGKVNASGKAGRWRRLPAPSAPKCFLLLTSHVWLLPSCLSHRSLLLLY